MRKLKNKAKNALALILSAAMIASTASVGWAAEEEAVVVVEDAEVTGQSETVPVSGYSQDEGAADSREEADAASEISQNELSVENVVVEEEKLSAENMSEPVQPEAPEAEEGMEAPEAGPAQPETEEGSESEPVQPGAEEGSESEPVQPGTEEGSEAEPTQPGTEEGSEPAQPEAEEELESAQPETEEGLEGSETEPVQPEVPEEEESEAAETEEEETSEITEVEEAESGADPEISEMEEQTEEASENSEIELLDDEETAAAAKNEDNYWLNVWDGNNNVYELLPGEQMEMFMEVWKDGEENPLDPSEYKLAWASSDESVATIKPGKRHSGMETWQQCATVTAAKKVDQNKENKTVITVKVQIGSVTKTETRDIYVHDGIWVITPRDDYGIQLYPGQSWKSGKPQMTYYALGKEPKVKNNIEFKWVYNPNKKGKDTYGKNEPVSLKRGKNGDLTITALDFNGKYGERNHIDLVATDPKDSDFQISNGFEVEVLYYNENNLQDNIEKNLYAGDSATFTINTDWIDGRLIESKPTVEWEVLKYDEASDKNKPTDNAVVKPVSGNKYKAKVTYKKPGNYVVYAKLKINGKTAGEVWGNNYDVRGETKEYEQWYANDLLPGYTICLEDQSRYYVDDADNPDMEYMLKYQNVKSSNTHAVSVRTEDGRTILQGENKGTSTITGTMIWTDSKGKNHKESLKVTLSVLDAVYRAELYMKSGKDMLFPKETGQLVLNVREEKMGSNKELDAKKYTVKWKNYDKNVLKISSNGKVTAKKYGSTNVTAEITIKGAGYKLQADRWINVTDGYFDMVPKHTEKDMYPGDVISFETPTVYWCQEGKKPVVRKDVKFEWWLNPDENKTWNDLDTNIYNIKVDKDHNIKSITVNRMPTDKEYEQGKNNLHIELHAINTEEGFEMASEWFDFWVNHAGGWIQSSDQQNFTGSELKLTWNGDFWGDSKNLKINWNIREQVWSDKAGDFVDAKKGSAASISAKGNGETATLKFINSGDGTGRVVVSATALYKGTEIGRTDERDFYFNDPWQGWERRSLVVFPGRDYVLNDEVVYSVNNETYPIGQAFPVTSIKNAKIVQQETADPAKKNKVLKLTKKANGKVVLEGLNSGRALIRAEFTAKVGKKTIQETYEEWYYVESVTYEGKLVNDKGTHDARPGSSLQFSVNFYKQTASGNSLLDKSKYTCTWKIVDGADAADISKDGKLKIHKNAEGRYINVYVKFKLKSDKNIWGEQNFDVWVNSTYDTIEVSDIEVRKGKTVTVKPVLKWYSDDYPNGYVEKNVKFTYKADPSAVQRIQVKGNKITGLMVGTQDLIISTEKNGQKLEQWCTVTVNP